jgi:hypothetical protein
MCQWYTDNVRDKFNSFIHNTIYEYVQTFFWWINNFRKLRWGYVSKVQFQLIRIIWYVIQRIFFYGQYWIRNLLAYLGDWFAISHGSMIGFPSFSIFSILLVSLLPVETSFSSCQSSKGFCFIFVHVLCIVELLLPIALTTLFNKLQ